MRRRMHLRLPNLGFNAHRAFAPAVDALQDHNDRGS
jgi:hypothetical protein